MPLIGKKDIFCINYSIIGLEDGYLLGNLSFFFGGQEIGDYEMLCNLSVVSNYFRVFLELENYKKRNLEHSHQMSKEEIYETLFDAYFNEANYRMNRELYNVSNVRDIFWLNEVGESSTLDKFGIVLLNELQCNRQRIVWKEFKSKTISEFFIPYGYFEEVSQEFLKAIRKKS